MTFRPVLSQIVQKLFINCICERCGAILNSSFPFIFFPISFCTNSREEIQYLVTQMNAGKQFNQYSGAQRHCGNSLKPTAACCIRDINHIISSFVAGICNQSNYVLKHHQVYYGGRYFIFKGFRDKKSMSSCRYFLWQDSYNIILSAQVGEWGESGV